MTPVTASTRPKRHVCERCGRAFSRSEHLTRHVLAHDKRKPFQCKRCGMSYGRADVLQRHSRKCEGNEPLGVRRSFSARPDSSVVDVARVSESDGGGFIARDSLDVENVQPQLDYNDFAIDQEMFLEDSLLFQFNYNHSGLTLPPTPTQGPTQFSAFEDGIGSLQLATPESVRELQCNGSVHNALQITTEDIQHFHKKIAQADPDSQLQHLRRPNISRVQRCLTAYYQYFDLHTPVIHFASFKVAEAHPALVLVMLAIGAVHLSEQKFSDSAYEAACLLLSEHEKQKILTRDDSFNLWYVQCAVLCAQFGACTGDSGLFYRAQQHLFHAQGAIYQGLDEIKERRKTSANCWDTWVYAESCSRIISWMFVVSAMCLALDASAVTMLPPMPCSMPPPSDESVWHAVSDAEWQFALQINPSNDNVDLWTITSAVMTGNTPDSCGPISAFTLLSLIGAVLATICTRQRLSQDIYDPFNGERNRLERAIAVWEGLWRRHPRAERNMTRLDHPLLNDCLSLLGSAYYHLYLGVELHMLKKISQEPRPEMKLPTCRDRGRILKVIKFAANSWLVRAKLGVRYLNRTGGLELGSQALITAYESALVLAWWLRVRAEVQPSLQEGCTSAEHADNVLVEKLFNEINEELDEQDICHDYSGAPLPSPIDFYRSVLDGRVWKCATVMDQRLRDFAAYMAGS